jgi:hypothetical protein
MTGDIDPSKVKPGDTVTVRVEPNPDMGWGALDHGPEAIEVTGKVWLDSGVRPSAAKVGVHALSLPNVTLIAHTPAPEPEPEYEVGHVYEATVANVGRVQVVRVAPELDADGPPLYPFPWFVPSRNDHYAERVVTDIRPLVVIDPATVDRTQVAQAIRGEGEPGTLDYMAAEVVLEHLGIEVPR